MTYEMVVPGLHLKKVAQSKSYLAKDPVVSFE